MRISLLKNNTDCLPVEASSMEELAEYSTKEYGWCPAIFKSNYRNLDNFISMDTIALDFDEGMSLEEASITFSGYQHFIGTSRSHQKEKVLKSGKVKPACDRFRVVFRLSRSITSDAEYKSTFEHLRQKFPAADPVCNDASRMFYPCVDIVQGDNEGILVDPVAPAPIEAKAPRRELTDGEKGKLARSTLEFITLGVKENRNKSAFKAAKDLQEQGYTQDEAEELLGQCPTLGEPGFGERDLLKAIKQAYKKEPKYDPRSLSQDSTAEVSGLSQQPKDYNGLPTMGISNSLKSADLLEEALAHLANPEATKGVSTGWREIDEVLGGLRASELIILQAFGKSGKTVFLTNMMANLTEQGHSVGFASLEMHPAKQVEPDLYSLLLSKNIRNGIDEKDKTKLSEMLKAGRGLTYFKRTRRPSPEEICEWMKNEHINSGINFFFIDHFAKFVPDESSVASISKTITALTGLKYENPKMCIVLIVQPTKSQKGRDGLEERVNKNTLRGGACIFEEADALINLHTKYYHTKEVETTWGWRRETTLKSYPSDVRELEFEAIRAKPYSDNMGTKLHMKYDKNTTRMTAYKWIAPDVEKVYQPEKEDREQYNGPRPQSTWAKNTFNRKRL